MEATGESTSRIQGQRHFVREAIHCHSVHLSLVSHPAKALRWTGFRITFKSLMVGFGGASTHNVTSKELHSLELNILNALVLLQ